MFFSIIACVLLVNKVSATPYNFNDARIVNGTDAELNEFPFMVSVRDTAWHSCGGSLISPEWVLTAAHCLQTTHVESYSIQYGVVKMSITGNSIASVSKYILHENYDYKSNLNDIALIKLTVPLEFNETVHSIKLPEKQNFTINGGSDVTLIGWGLNSSDSSGTYMEILQKVNLKIVSQPECDERNIEKVHWSNICAEANGKGSCSSDSGGPLFVNGTQFGIVSWGERPCGNDIYPQVFTDVSAFRDWIRNHTGV